MKRFICLGCLLLPWMTVAAAPPPALASPAAERAQSRPRVTASAETTAQPPVYLGQSGIDFTRPAPITPGSVLTAQKSVGPATSLLHVDLTRRVRLAVVGRPDWTRDTHQPPVLNLPLLSLRW